MSNILWVTYPPNRRSIPDTRLVTLSKPLHNQRLDPTTARRTWMVSHSSVLGLNDYVHCTFFQDPRNIPVDRNMYPFFKELLDQLPKGVPVKAFQLVDVPSLRMSAKKIHTDFVLQEKKLPFEVRLWT